MAKRQTLSTTSRSTVKDAAFLENSVSGDDVDLRKLPAPVWHAKDGGPYIGSGSIVIMRDPDTRLDQRLDLSRAGARPEQGHRAVRPSGRHGAIIAKKYWDAGKSCPLAIVNGMDPALFIAGFEYLAAGQSEYEFAGAIKGAPIEVIAGPKTGLPLPAQRRDHPRRRAAAAG